MNAGGEVVQHETIPSCDREIASMPPLWKGFTRSRLDLAWSRSTWPSCSARAVADVCAGQLDSWTLHPRGPFSRFDNGGEPDPSPKVVCCDEI